MSPHTMGVGSEVDRCVNCGSAETFTETSPGILTCGTCGSTRTRTVSLNPDADAEELERQRVQCGRRGHHFELTSATCSFCGAPRQ